MSAEFNQYLYAAWIVATLLGIGITLSGKWAGSLVALVGLVALAATWLLDVLNARSLPPVSDVAALEWQRKLEEAKVAQAHAERSVRALSAEILKGRAEFAQEKQAHNATRALLLGERESLLQSDRLRKAVYEAGARTRQEILRLVALTIRLDSQVNLMEKSLAAEEEAHSKARTQARIVRRVLANAMAHPVIARTSAIRDCHAVEGAQTLIAAELKSALDAGVSKTSYEVRPSPDSPVITGRAGTYYAVTLKRPTPNYSSGTPFAFSVGHYNLTGGEPPFLAALDTLIQDVISKIPRHVRYEVFVRGSADDREFKVPPPATNYQEFMVISYLPRDPSEANRYANISKDQRLGQVIANAQLPNIRGAYIARLIAARLTQITGQACIQPIVLHQAPQGPARNPMPEVFLLIAW
jgi:hypothetical protein